jgi:hypothetical protein
MPRGNRHRNTAGDNAGSDRSRQFGELKHRTLARGRHCAEAVVVQMQMSAVNNTLRIRESLLYACRWFDVNTDN